jgi:hypothetical protein
MARIAAKASHPRATTSTLGSRLLAMLALVAFLLQSMAVQTHVHPAGPHSLDPGTVVAMALSASDPLKNLKTNPGACRLCQEIAHAGTYIVPAVILPAALLAIKIWQPAAEDQALQPAALSFIWQSRGPPNH